MATGADTTSGGTGPESRKTQAPGTTPRRQAHDPMERAANIKADLARMPEGDGEQAASRSQFGALCWRHRGKKIEVLLITSRDTGRWLIPKGWPIEGLGPAGSAAREAFEEAGVEGNVSDQPVGYYSYIKTGLRNGKRKADLPCVVGVYALHVSRLLDKYPERGERRRKWFAAEKAAQKVAEPELRRILEGCADHLPAPTPKA